MYWASIRLKSKISEVFADLQFTDCAPTWDPGHEFVTVLNFFIAHHVLSTPDREYLITTHNAPKKRYVRVLQVGDFRRKSERCAPAKHWISDKASVALVSRVWSALQPEPTENLLRSDFGLIPTWNTKWFDSPSLEGRKNHFLPSTAADLTAKMAEHLRDMALSGDCSEGCWEVSQRGRTPRATTQRST